MSHHIATYSESVAITVDEKNKGQFCLKRVLRNMLAVRMCIHLRIHVIDSNRHYKGAVLHHSIKNYTVSYEGHLLN